MNLEKLMAEHDRIDVAIAALAASIANEEPNTAAVTCALFDLNNELTEHLAHEDSFIYPKMIGGKNAAGAATARQFVKDFENLRTEWDNYLVEWQPECIEHDWAHFRESTVWMTDQLSKRVSAENTLLYTAALKSGSITLRD
ncbi:MAG: hemerythrin domain-containing protein [Pseudomonadota bacterium]